MNNKLRGRVVEVWEREKIFYIEIIVEDQRYVLTVPNQNDATKLSKGDLIQATLNQKSQWVGFEKLGAVQERVAWDPTFDGMRWRRLTAEPTRMSRLRQRQEILSCIREDLYGEGFLEVETPLLVKGTCPDTHIQSILAEEGCLVTSTEYQIKRLMVGGFEKVFTLTKNFRAHDRGQFHSSEFTMLEWARAFETLDDIEKDLTRFIRKAFQRLYPNVSSLRVKDAKIEILNEPWESLTVSESFHRYLGLEGIREFSLPELLEGSEKVGLSLPTQYKNDLHGLLSYLLDRVQSHLGKRVPTFLKEWPSFMTSSGEVTPKSSWVSERTELYINGIEIADGFPFLTNAKLQAQFFSREIQKRKQEGKTTVPIDFAYLKALEQGIPPGAGMALGIDRLVMILTGAQKLTDVQAFSWDEL